ncbi:hypothetical protein AA313_de0209549 [Arthrobotrys entomopaga]|nr:hypothetical protein AA313_de0209549 [Arthrobotrys entomopaga]
MMTAREQERNAPRTSLPNEAGSRLQSIMKGGKKPKKERRRGRVSFTRQDELVEYNQDEETSIKDARNGWTASIRPSQAAEQWEEEDREQNRLLERASAYDSEYHHNNRGHHLPNAGSSSTARESRDRSPRESLGHPRPYRQQIPTGARIPQNRTQPANHRGSSDEETSPSMRAAARGQRSLRPQREKGHFHRHGYTGCEHWFLDPIDCSCEDTERVIKAKGSCNDCVVTKKQLKSQEMSSEDDIATREEDDGSLASKTDAGLLKRMGRMLLF